MKVLFWSMLALIGLQNPNIPTTTTDITTSNHIEVGSLFAQDMTEGVLLSWNALAQEENIEFYSIERSVDGFAFEEIAIVEVGIGTGEKYEFVDATALAGTNFYRVAKTPKNYFANLVFGNATVQCTAKTKDTASLE